MTDFVDERFAKMPKINQLSYIDRIKLVMMMAMTLGHIAWVFVPTDSTMAQLMHFVGRLTMPLACFLVVQGFVLTHDVMAYIKRMFGFGLLAQVPFVMTWFGVYRLIYEPSLVMAALNVLFTLGFGLLALCCVRAMTGKRWQYKVLFGLMIAVLFMLSQLADWGMAVLVWVLAIYYGRFLGFLVASVLMFVVAALVPEDSVWRLVNPSELMDYGVFLSVPIMWAYDAFKQHSPKTYRLPRTLFYWYYVLHLLVLGLVGQYSPWAIDEYQLRCQTVDCRDLT